MGNKRGFRIQLPASQAGFTFLELLASVLLTSVMLGAMYNVFRMHSHTTKAQESRLEAQEYGRSSLDMMVREIRNAGLNPLGADPGLGCGGGIFPGVPGIPGIVSATDKTISFTYDFRDIAAGSSPNSRCDDPDEQITYEFLSPGPQGCTGGHGDIIRTANGVPAALTDCNVTNLTLTYYAFNSSTPMSLPVVAADIQRVEISLTITAKNPEAEFSGGLTTIMKSNVDLRNRGLGS